MKKILSLACVLFTTVVYGITVTIIVDANDHCGQGDGQLRADVSGGLPPYTYAWSSGGTNQWEYNLVAGSYSVTVTDANLQQATNNATVLAVDHSEQFTAEGAACEPYCAFTGIPGVPFFRWSVDDPENFGPGPYLFNGEPPLPDQLDPYLYYVGIPGNVGQQVQMNYLDGNGCGGTFFATVCAPVDWPSVDILQIEGACNGEANGSLLVAYGEEGSLHQVSAEIRDMQDAIVVDGGWDWWGYWPEQVHYTGLPAGDYRIIQRLTMQEGISYYEYCSQETLVTIPELGAGCGNVNGTVFMDYDADCVIDGPGETRVPGALLEFTPGPYYTTADEEGAYTVNLPVGGYTVQHIAADIGQHCPPPPAPLTVIGTQTLDIADTALVPLDAQIAIASGPARPGFELHYAIQQRNLTPANTGTTTTVMTFDPVLTFVSATPNGVVSGNTITWTQSALGAFAERTTIVRLQVPPDMGLLGSVLNASVILTTANTDAVTANNTASTNVTVTGSYDPNDKTALTSSQWSDSLYYIDVDEWIDYTIHFQNTGTDTAFNVIITDTLPATLNPATIEWGATSHAGMRSVSGQGLLKCIFPYILLPDSTVNEAASHGFASFRIRAREPLLPGTVIENIANIFFDYNPPVITDPSMLTAEFSTSAGHPSAGPGRRIVVYPNPAIDHLRLSDPTFAANTQAWSIIGADGRIVRIGSTPFPTDGLGIGDLGNGSYVLRLVTDAGTVNERFIKIERP